MTDSKKYETKKSDFFLQILLVVAVLWFGLGMAIVPSSKIYKQVLVLVLYLPCLYLIFKNFNLIDKFFKSYNLFSSLIVFLFFYSLLFAVFSQDWQSARHVLYLVLFLTLGVFIPSIVDEKFLIKAANAALIVVSVFSLYTMYDFFIVKGEPITARMWGLWGAEHPILGSYYVAFFAFVSLFFIVEYKRYFHCITFFLFVLYIAFSQSRGAYLGFFVSFFIYWLVFNFKNKRAILLFLIFIFFATIFLIFFKEQVVSRGSSYRFDVWLKGISLAVEQFWFGHGVGFEYTLPGTFDNAVPYYANSHNLLIHIWIQLGMIGLSVFSFLWMMCLYLCYKFKELVLARFNFILIIFSSIAFQFDAARFIEAPRLEWFVVWVPICLTIAVLMVSMKKFKLID